MPKFRKKPVVIEAWCFERGAQPPLWLVQKAKEIRFMDSHIAIETLEGTMTASIGDWIIKGVNDEIYPCKPDIFEKTYEPVIENTMTPEQLLVHATLSGTARIPLAEIGVFDPCSSSAYEPVRRSPLTYQEPVKDPAAVMTPEQIEEAKRAFRAMRRAPLAEVVSSIDPGPAVGELQDLEDVEADIKHGLILARDHILRQRAEINALRAQLEAEGAHTEAATAKVDEMQRQLDRSLLDGQ